MVFGLLGAGVHEPAGELLVGLDDGDDAAVVRIAEGTAVIVTADFFTPVVDDPSDWGRIAATNALSDVYAMSGTPVVVVAGEVTGVPVIGELVPRREHLLTVR